MVGMEEELERTIDDQPRRIVIRGKRTKRHRLALSSSSTAGESNSSPANSSELCESTEEEEDMANCLILLAQGGGGDRIERRQERCSSRKFTEIMASTAAAPPGKVGFYVYECKTCNRTFPSFQALGGHRASHKKPKTAAEEEKLAAPVPIPIPQSSAVAADHQSNDVKLSKSNKIHECSICGAEFASGQALGGHMRRHRATPALAKPMISVGDNRRQDHEEKVARNILDLDLNLPAPEDDRREFTTPTSKFQYASAKQSIVFSAPTLVDCHY